MFADGQRAEKVRQEEERKRSKKERMLQKARVRPLSRSRGANTDVVAGARRWVGALV